MLLSASSLLRYLQMPRLKLRAWKQIQFPQVGDKDTTTEVIITVGRNVLVGIWSIGLGIESRHSDM